MSDLPAAADLALSRAASGASARTPARGADADAARQAAESFEATFIGQMLEPMFAGLSTDGPFGGGHGEQVFRSMLITQYGELIAHRGGFGIADSVMAEMIRIQEAQGSPQPPHASAEGSARAYRMLEALGSPPGEWDVPPPMQDTPDAGGVREDQP